MHCGNCGNSLELAPDYALKPLANDKGRAAILREPSYIVAPSVNFDGGANHE